MSFVTVSLPFESTFTSLGFDDVHVTFCDGLTVALSVQGSPAPSVTLVLSSLIVVLAGSLTVTLQDADIPSTLAVIVAVPLVLAVTLPFLSTEATLEFDDDHDTALFVPVTVVLNVYVLPLVRVRLVLSSLTEGFAEVVTVTPFESYPLVNLLADELIHLTV